MKQWASHILSLLIIAGFLLLPFQTVSAQGVDTPFGSFSDEEVDAFIEGPNPDPSLLQNVTRGVLDLSVCSGKGSISNRLKDAAKGAAGIIGGSLVKKGLSEFGEWISGGGGGLLEGIGGALGLAAPGVGSLAGGLLSSVLGLGGSKLQTVTAPELESKDNCLDALARASAQEVFGEVARSTLTWLTGGFEDGNVGFVYDLDGRLRAATDQEFFRFLKGGVFDNVCDAFKSDVAITLQNNFYKNYNDPSPERVTALEKVVFGNTSTKCGLERVVKKKGGNLEKFLEGDFSQGGWEAWQTLVTDPESNPYSSVLQKEGELARGVERAQQNEREQLAWGGGYLPQEICNLRAEAREYENPETGKDETWWVDPESDVRLRKAVKNLRGNREPTPCLRTEIVTPASTVQRVVNEVLTGDVRRAEYADEFNEVVNGAGNWLISKIFKGDGEKRGLRGLDPSSYNPAPNVDATLRAKRLRVQVKNAIEREKAIQDDAEVIIESSQTLRQSDVQDYFIETAERGDRTFVLPGGINDIGKLLGDIRQCSADGLFESDKVRVETLLNRIDRNVTDAEAALQVVERNLGGASLSGQTAIRGLVSIQEEVNTWGNSPSNEELERLDALERAFQKLILHTQEDEDEFDRKREATIQAILDLSQFAVDYGCGEAAPAVEAPDVSGFHADPAQVVRGQSTTLFWSVEGAQQCVMSTEPVLTPPGEESWERKIVDRNVGSSIETPALSGTTRFFLSCFNQGIGVQSEVTVTVQ